MAETLFDKVRALDCQTVIENISGAQFKGKFTLCPLPGHNEKTGSFSIDKKRNKWKCFGCNAGGSTIDFVMHYKGVDELEAARIIAKYYGIDDSPQGGIARVDKKPVPVIKKHPAANLDAHAEISEAQKKLNADFIRRCAADRRADCYFKERGFTDETIKGFHLGYDGEKDGIVIPYSDKFEYQITRLMSPSDPKKPYRKPREKEWGSCPIWGEEAIDNGGVIFIVESQLCAISIAQAGGVAVGLGGLGAIDQLLREIAKRDKERKCIFVVALDNDDAGKAAQAKLVEQMKILGIKFIEFNVAGEVKDPNELLQTNMEALTANVKVAIEEANRVEEKPKTIDKEQAVRDLLSEPPANLLDVFKAEYIDALAYAKKNLPSAYAIFKTTLKGKVNLNDLESAIKHATVKSKKAAEEQELTLDGMDLNGAIAPRGWTITLNDGVRKLVVTRDSEREVIACPDAVVITKRLVNFDNEKERFEIAFFKDNRWRTLTASRTQVYNKSTIINFGDTGLHVTSGTAGDLVGYLSDYETINKKVIPRIASISRIGWLTETEFFPFATDSEVVFEEDSPSLNIYQDLREQGDYGKWKDMMRKLRKNPFARFITSASFAAPLLEPLDVRSFVIHIWNVTGAGKSAVLKAAISAWGYFQGIMCNANATKNGIEYFTAALKHLPLGIDEKQAANKDKFSFEDLVYMLGENQGKTRGAKGGGTQKTVTWHTLAIITGEEPITSQFTGDGMQTRVLELKGKPVDDKEFAKSVHAIVGQNFGYAGAEFLRAVCALLKANKNSLRERFDDIKAKFKERGVDSVQEDYVIAVTLGDILAETLIFGTDNETAERDAIETGLLILKNNDEQKHDDNVETAYESVRNWLLENGANFEAGALRCFGKKKELAGGSGTEYSVLTTPLNEFLSRSGYNVTKVISGFAERGLLPTERDKRGKKRYSTTAWIDNTAVRAYKFVMTNALPTEQCAEQPPQAIQATLIPLNDDENLPF